MISFFRSSIGKKIIVAATGIIMIGFLMGHMAGNLQIFLGPEKFNNYAAFLHKNPGLIWGTRLLLLVSVFFHILCTIHLAIHNRASRPIGYEQTSSLQATFSSRFMVASGLFLAIYIVYHIFHFTVGSAHPNFSGQDIYRNVIEGFSVRWVAWVYIVAMICVGFHLHHGVWSVFQTLGLNHPKYNCSRRLFATGLALFISVGFISIPAAVLLGVLR